jgi:hypothetical protein
MFVIPAAYLLLRRRELRRAAERATLGRIEPTTSRGSA